MSPVSPKGNIVIVGASHAALAVASELRAAGCSSPIVLVGREEGLPYHRPHLSKECLATAPTAPRLLKPASFFTEQAVELVTGNVAEIDRATQSILTESGQQIPYATLILATGARSRRLPSSIEGYERAITLRDKTDLARLTEAFSNARKVAIIGGGFIGLEVASAAQALGCSVVVLEAADRLLARSVYPVLADEVLARHQRVGIEFRFGVRIQSITETGVKLGDGGDLEADFVLAAIGSEPRHQLARDAGISTNAQGVHAGPEGKTSDPLVYALGDCASWSNGSAHVRHESVAATQQQAKSVAADIMGNPAPTLETLRLWSTQGPLRLQMAGPVELDADAQLEVVENGQILRAFRGGQLIAVQALNAPRAFNTEVARLGAL